MLKHRLLHPGISAALGRAGHHDKILIADGNYPAATTLGPNAELVSLNLAPGLVSVAQVLEVLLTAIPVAAVHTMSFPPDDPLYGQAEPAVWNDFRRLLQEAGFEKPLEPIQKWDFYNAVASRELVLTIQTGDQALWANVLLSVGVRNPEQ